MTGANQSVGRGRGQHCPRYLQRTSLNARTWLSALLAAQK